MQFGIQGATEDEPVTGIPESESIGRKIDGDFQAAQQMPRMGGIAPQDDPSAFGCLTRFDLDDAAIGQLDIARNVLWPSRPPRSKRRTKRC